MLRSSSVGTARIGTTVPPRSIDPRLFQARATRPRPRPACATDDSEAARTRRVPRRGPVPLCCSSFVVRRSSFVVRRSSFVVRRSSFVVRRSSFAWPLRRRCARSYKVRMSTSSRVRAAPNGSDPARTGLAGNERWEPVLHTVTLAAASRFHRRQGRDARSGPRSALRSRSLRPRTDHSLERWLTYMTPIYIYHEYVLTPTMGDLSSLEPWILLLPRGFQTLDSSARNSPSARIPSSPRPASTTTLQLSTATSTRGGIRGGVPRARACLRPIPPPTSSPPPRSLSHPNGPVAPQDNFENTRVAN